MKKFLADSKKKRIKNKKLLTILACLKHSEAQQSFQYGSSGYICEEIQKEVYLVSLCDDHGHGFVMSMSTNIERCMLQLRYDACTNVLTRQMNR